MSLLDIEIFTVDAFTKSPLMGNPAAVCILESSHVESIHNRFPSEEEKDNFYKLIAREMNLSETCFLWRVGSNIDRYKLRWFTPKVEVNMCGHGSLASSKILFSKFESLTKLFFETKSGELTVEKENELLKMNFPQGEPQIIYPNGLENLFQSSVLTELLNNINLTAETIDEIVLCRKTKKLLIVVKDFKQVLCAEPNDQALLNMDFKNEDLNTNIRGISISMSVDAMSEENREALSKLADFEVTQIDYVTRYFSPWYVFHICSL